MSNDTAVEELRWIKTNADERRALVAPEDALIRDLCERIGYGAVMDSAARQWQRKDLGGAFTVGPPVGRIDAALNAAQPRQEGAD